MLLTPRDRAAIHAVYRYRYLTARHLEWLIYAGIARRNGQHRLRLLWEHGFLDRHWFSSVSDGTAESIRGLRTPVYMLAHAGARVVAADFSELTWAEIPKNPKENRQGYVRLRHNLVATDVLVAAEAAVMRVGWSASTQTEHHLWQGLKQNRRRPPFVVSDGALTLHHPNAPSTSYHLEVVRADVKRGNQTLFTKMKKYVELNRRGFFRDAFGHERVRAVLIATTTAQRAENFRALAAELPHGRNLFLFTGYERRPSAGPPETIFTPDTITTPLWFDVDGQPHSLIPAVESPA